MIDVSQWRASIGLWNYCQAASSRPANSRRSFKAAVDSKSGSTRSTSGEKTSKLPAALSLIVSLLLSLLRYMKLNFIPLTGIITVTVIHCLQSLVLFIAAIGSSSDLIYYLVLLLLILLSGDIERNPGPISTDIQEYIISFKFTIGKMLRILKWTCNTIIKFFQSVWIQIKSIFLPKQYNSVPLQTRSTHQPEDTVINIYTPHLFYDT
uniref:Uncharacterized protein n=1 Tax=Amphimedon queenslandica TaxID=400682 RepID=A0A1X7TRN7_AMPQE